MALRRGFKAEAERLSKDIWAGMGLTPDDRMDAVKLAEHVGCMVRSADDLVDKAKLEELYRAQDDAFFACTFELPRNRFVVVFNPLMSEKRRNSDLAHEVAHIVLGHSLSRLARLGDLAFLTCDRLQEEEAAWLSGCLLLPRFALMNDLRKRKTYATIAESRMLSKEMVDYRARVTGVSRQLAAARRRRAS
ncbi:MAG: ImmA/IrrE family metallo-endopeptidase [Holophagales bacterium]|nr:ImmA/IrrE family metallo-endopeptidase [Holophagales bacterium]MYD23854.1 ImmA/IrrE family metallo-endopeptidase [Holophagales bacterium]